LAETEANLLTETCQNVNLQNQCKQAHEGQASDMTEVQNPYEIPLNAESIVFIERPDETASTSTALRIIGDNVQRRQKQKKYGLIFYCWSTKSWDDLLILLS